MPNETTIIDNLLTEQSNPRTAAMDMLPVDELVRALHAENHLVAQAIDAELGQVAQAVTLITERISQGGRLFYIGAGTSGRLGVLDASECPPTFGVDSSLIQGIIAGGDGALRNSVEGAEDEIESGAEALHSKDVGDRDVVVGIAASGRTPYVIGALEYGRAHGAATIAIVNTLPAPMASMVDIAIAPLTGAEPLAGSTRLKAGTAQKMVLNLISTGVMVRLGKTYGNLMVDVRPTNAKLKERAIGIMMSVTGAEREACVRALDTSDWQVKPAIVALAMGISTEEAHIRLDRANGFVRHVLDETYPET